MAFAALVLTAASTWAASTKTQAAAGLPTHVLDLGGRPVEVLPAAGSAPAVLVFSRTDCPIANRYAPELTRLRARFARRGLAFWLVYVDRSEPLDAIRRHAAEFGKAFGAVRDPDHELVRAARATVTPEAAVFVGSETGPALVYRGRIDDRYVDFGRARAAPTSRDLERVLEALASGATIERRTTTALGCFITAPE